MYLSAVSHLLQLVCPSIPPRELTFPNFWAWQPDPPGLPLGNPFSKPHCVVLHLKPRVKVVSIAFIATVAVDIGVTALAASTLERSNDGQPIPGPSTGAAETAGGLNKQGD